MNVAQQLPEMKAFFEKWYPSFARIADHPRVQQMVETGDEQGLIDLLYQGAWDRIKHKLHSNERIQFKREFDQMLDAIFPGRAGGRAQEVEKYPIMAGLRRRAQMASAEDLFKEIFEDYKQRNLEKWYDLVHEKEDNKKWRVFTDDLWEEATEKIQNSPEEFEEFEEEGYETISDFLDDMAGTIVEPAAREERATGTRYYEPTRKHDIKPQPYEPGYKSPRERKREIDEAYHLLHGKSRFSLYRNVDRALRTNRVRIAKRLSAQHQTACLWCPELRPGQEPNMIKVAIEGSHGICEECKKKMLEEINLG